MKKRSCSSFSCKNHMNQTQKAIWENMGLLLHSVAASCDLCAKLFLALAWNSNDDLSTLEIYGSMMFTAKRH